MIVDELEKILDLSESEKKIFRDNYFEYEDTIMELITVYRRYVSLLSEKSRLHTNMARYNFDIYETWMAVHKNAISLSSYRAEANLRNLKVESSIWDRLNEIIEEYVLIEKFM